MKRQFKTQIIYHDEKKNQKILQQTFVFLSI